MPSSDHARRLPDKLCAGRTNPSGPQPADMPLSDTENCMMGILCGATDCTLLQSTNYWKTRRSRATCHLALHPGALPWRTVNVLHWHV